MLPFAEWLTADMVSRPEARALLALMATQNPLNPHSRSLVELLHAGGDELLRDDSTRLAERASAAGCDATIEVWPEMQHVFQIAAGKVPESDSAVAKLGAWLSNRLAD